MSASEEQFTEGQQALRSSLRFLAEAALRLEDARLTEMLQVIGKIASASVELDAVVAASFVRPTAPLPAGPIAEADIPTTPVVLIALPEILEPAAVDAVADQSTETVMSGAALFKSIPEKFHGALAYMIGKSGQDLAPSEITKQIPGPTPEAQRQAFRRFVDLLQGKSGPYVLNDNGRSTAARRYSLDMIPGSLAEKISLPEPVTVEDKSNLPVVITRPAAHPTPLVMPPRRQLPPETKQESKKEDDVVITLTNWGLEFVQNGHRQIQLNGQPLKLRESSATALFELAQSEDGLMFDELLARMKAHATSTDPKILRGMLKEIETSLHVAAQNKWIDEFVETEDGRNRHVQLVGSQPAVVIPDFLVPQSSKK